MTVQAISIKQAIQDRNLMEMINLLKGVGTKEGYSFGQEYFGLMANTSRREILKKLTGHFLSGAVLSKNRQ